MKKIIAAAIILIVLSCTESEQKNINNCGCIEKELMKSPYTLQVIRERLSGAFETRYIDDPLQMPVLELVLCLANEIAELKEEINKINKL